MIGSIHGIYVLVQGHSRLDRLVVSINSMGLCSSSLELEVGSLDVAYIVYEDTNVAYEGTSCGDPSCGDVVYRFAKNNAEVSTQLGLLSNYDRNEFLSWFTKFDKSKLQFDLIYHSETHGKNAYAFQSRCADQGATLLIASLEDGKVVGGFTSIPWSRHGGLKADETAFLFTLAPLMRRHEHLFGDGSMAVKHDGFRPIFGQYDLLFEIIDLKAMFTIQGLFGSANVYALPNEYRTGTTDTCYRVGTVHMEVWSVSCQS